MNVETIRIIWDEAEEISSRILALRKNMADLDMEPELVGKLMESYVGVCSVIAHVRNYEVTEDGTAANRRAAYEQVNST